jgi:hypothetical protein
MMLVKTSRYGEARKAVRGSNCVNGGSEAAVKADPPCGCHNRMVVASMSAPAVDEDLLRWELAIPDLDLIKQVE